MLQYSSHSEFYTLSLHDSLPICSYWLANNLIYITGAWNTDKVKKGEEPKALEDFADPRWKDRLIAEPRDVELLIGDRKSTRLNSSHMSISYAVFCLKKKT